MRIYSAEETAQALSYPTMIEAMQASFKAGQTAPARLHYSLPNAAGEDSTLLIMPAWQGNNGFGGIKLVNVTPTNAERGLPSIAASYLLFREETGEHLALFDGAVLTARRTAAASALGARYLANPDAQCLLIIGAGRVASELPEAFSSLFPLKQILIWNRNRQRAEDLAACLQSANRWQVNVVDDLSTAVPQADIISCATMATEPVLKGEWLRAGQHIDLIGSYKPTMREADNAVLARAQVYIDTEMALKESGDLSQPLASGDLARDAIRGTLYDLCKQQGSLYDPSQITLFKGVGYAIEDLACAQVAYQTTQT